MIHKISESSAKMLASREVIKDEEIDIYTYGFETLFSGIIDLIITLCIGLLFRRMLTAIVYFLMFTSVRMYTGGYHADTYLKCKLIYIGITLAIVASSYVVMLPFHGVILFVLMFMMTVSNICPIENPKKPLSDDQKKKYRLIGILCSAFWSIAAFITYFYITYLSMVIICNSFVITLLILIEGYRKGGDNYEKKLYP